MTKKTHKSKASGQHKKQMDPDLLKEEFGTEMGDYNSAKFLEAASSKKKTCK
ncbi:hypothetical protein [Metabacillus indicus]|uniref:hypothetical protein n=1 Tax=Metabacillus indicus TaxID=246786 RepID=UPI003CF91AAB